MALIQVEDLTFSYPSGYETIFDHVSFQLDTRWKLGLIGRNGRGKTTLLRLLMGEYEYGGTIRSPVEYDYFPYPVPHPERPTGEVLSQVCPSALEWEWERELSCLGVEIQALERPFSTLSNGERTKVLLAALFLNEGRFLLIDEPTNHLDLQARESVSAYLRQKRGFILVSHDRAFLDGCVDHILSLNRSDIQVQSGNFSSWLANFQRQQAFELAQDQRLRREIRDLRQAAQRTAAWSDRVEASKYGGGVVDRGFVGHKAAKMMKRSKSLAVRQQRAIEEKAGLLKNLETAEELKLSPLTDRGDILITCSGAAPVYDGAPVCDPVSFTLRRGERVVLDGRNGSGKTSLLRLLCGQPMEHLGTVSVSAGVVLSYVPQDTACLRGSLAAFARDSGLEEPLFRAILRKLGFARVQFDTPLEDLSGGLKKKVLLARSLCQRAHVYVWDEPLNFLDIDARMQLEDLIRSVSPAMVLVEHDSAFRSAVATRTIRLQRSETRPARPAEGGSEHV